MIFTVKSYWVLDEKATENIDAGYDALNIDDYPDVFIF
jgi:hypothetical protein